MWRDTVVSEFHKKAINSQKFFENILGSMLDILIVINSDATIRFVNRATMETLGYDPEDIEGMPADKLFDGREMSSADFVRDLMTHGEVRGKELWMMGASGKRVPVVLNGAVIRDDDNRIDGMVWVARDMRGVHHLINELVRTNAELENHVNRRTEELRVANEAGEEALKELRHIQTQLVQSEKMASIGQLAAGIAHEINNPTGFVSSNLKTLEEYMKDIKVLLGGYDAVVKRCERVTDKELSDAVRNIEKHKAAMDISFLMSDVDELISEARDGMKRITKIVKDLRGFSHAGSDKPEYTDINKGIESTLNIVWNELKYKADVRTEYGDIPQVLCYPQQLNQVFMNFLVNAAQAIKEKGEIKIRTLAERDHVVVEVSDTGEGIPFENLSRIFEPFSTTKPVGKGTGLGLSMVYAIVQKHGGFVKVESEVGKGSCFRVFIPIEYCQLIEDKVMGKNE